MKITREQFERECKRRFGADNPEPMNIGYWEFMVRRGGDPYSVRRELGLPPHYGSCSAEGCGPGEGPDWCFDRFGMTRTPMPDGRVICVAGEHEDFYDPDFCIYNDVIVLRPASGETDVSLTSGEVELYGYPAEVFPPTDFHSATLVDDRIIIVGRLGYYGSRSIGPTPVMQLDTRSYRITPTQTTGANPGWIYRHHADYDEERHAITVRGGMIDIGDRKKETPHLAAYRLHLDGMCWEMLAEAESPRRFLIERDDDYDREIKPVTDDMFRVEGLPARWLPPDYRGVETYQISVQGVRVTFEDFFSEIRVFVEGALPEEITDQIMTEVTAKLRAGTGAGWEYKEVDRWE